MMCCKSISIQVSPYALQICLLGQLYRSLGPDAEAPSAAGCSLEWQPFLRDTCSESNKRSHAHGAQHMASVLGKQPQAARVTMHGI